MELDKINITIDDDCRIRVLESDKFKSTEDTHREATAFISKIQDFRLTLSGLVEILEGLGKKIEREKLKAIGQRNRLDGEMENRMRMQLQLQGVIAEKMAELERYNTQYQSLLRVEAEQNALIDKLSNNEA